MEWNEKWLINLIKLLRTHLRSEPCDRIAYVVLPGGRSGNPILRGFVKTLSAARPYGFACTQAEVRLPDCTWCFTGCI